MVTTGILAVQGDFAAHAAALGRIGAGVVPVRKPGDLAGLDALVLPVGESTAMLHGIDRDGLGPPCAPPHVARRAGNLRRAISRRTG